MNKLVLSVLVALLAFGNSLFGQARDTLPRFSLKNVGSDRILVEWVNTFENVKQISIQRSFDSLKNFKTILTVPDPSLPANGYMDTKAPNDHMFYRLYILLDKGSYLFSDTKKPAIDTFTATGPAPVAQLNDPLLQADGWVASRYVYTVKDGYVRISLPGDSLTRYDLKFFTITDEPLFELKGVKERNFKIDKANFYRSGWFKFELYENDRMKEKNRFFLPKDF